MSELISHSDCEKFFDKVMKLDENIRYAAIYDGQYHAKLRNGIQRYFTDEEIKSSLSEALNRWSSRKKMSFKLGEPKFAMAQYDKVNRLTFPLGGGGVILVTTELEVDLNKLVDEILEILNTLRYSVSGFSTR